MEPTPISLLEQLREPGAAPAWDRFVALYSPLLYVWASRLGVTDADADDLVQDVFTTLVQALPDFRYDQNGRFRGWLWTLTRNKVRDRVRRRAATIAAVSLEEPGLPSGSDPAAEFDDREYREYVTTRALELLKSDFDLATWQAFWETAVDGRSAPEVAAELGMTPNAVYLARGRVLRRLRVELAGLFD